MLLYGYVPSSCPELVYIDESKVMAIYGETNATNLIYRKILMGNGGEVKISNNIEKDNVFFMKLINKDISAWEEYVETYTKVVGGMIGIEHLKNQLQEYKDETMKLPRASNIEIKPHSL